MARRVVTIEISPDGTATLIAEGYPGDACLHSEIVKALMEEFDEYDRVVELLFPSAKLTAENVVRLREVE